MRVDKQFHVDKDEMKTVKAKWSEIIKIKWRKGVTSNSRGQDYTLPSVGLMASGKVSHGRVHVGHG